MLENLPEISAVKAEQHRGVHESIFFSHFAKNFGNWQNPQSRSDFEDAFLNSDYYQLTKFSSEFLSELVNRSEGFGDVFIKVMDALAERENAQGWLEKSPHHTLMYKEISAAVPSAKFIMVERDTQSIVASRLHGFGRSPKRGIKFWADIFRGTITVTLYTQYMKKIARLNENALLIKYEDLLNQNADLVKKEIIYHIGIVADVDKMTSQFSANTSYDRPQSSPIKFGWFEKQLMQCARLCARCVPLTLLVFVKNQRDKSRGADWPDWVWTMKDFNPKM